MQALSEGADRPFDTDHCFRRSLKVIGLYKLKLISVLLYSKLIFLKVKNDKQYYSCSLKNRPYVILFTHMPVKLSDRFILRVKRLRGLKFCKWPGFSLTVHPKGPTFILYVKTARCRNYSCIKVELKLN